MISKAMISARFFAAVLRMTCSQRFAIFAFEHFTTIFRTPNTVVFAAVDNLVVRLVPEYHKDLYTKSFYLMKWISLSVRLPHA